MSGDLDRDFMNDPYYSDDEAPFDFDGEFDEDTSYDWDADPRTLALLDRIDELERQLEDLTEEG